MLSKKNIALLAIILTLVVLFTAGCKSVKTKEEFEDELPQEILDDEEAEDEEDDNSRETLVYYQNDAGYLVPVMRRITWEEGIAKATLRKMIDSPEQQQDLMAMGLKPLLPEGTEILGMSIKDGLAKLDLNKKAMEFNSAVEESNMVQGVTLTLTDFSTIDRVQFLFEGKIVDTLKYGTDVSKPIEPQDVNLELSSSAGHDGDKVTVFFHSSPDAVFNYIVPVTRIVEDEQVSIETAIRELLRGPRDTGLNMDIPADTKLLGVQVDDGVTYINFSKEFEELAQLPQSEAMVLKSIIMTARQFPNVDEVIIMVEGKEYDGGQISVSAFANEY
ncbi:MAG: GerMN domain-containing protein [Clostridiales bacterium]|nr:GerMN domain-containing protein [Clostridiales bacterium]